MPNPLEQDPQSQSIIEATRLWIKTVIVKFNFCPFARQELENQTIRYIIDESSNLKQNVATLLSECRHLDEHPQVETTLVIYPDQYPQFDHYLTLVDKLQSKVIDRQYEGIYQLASFHSDYCFADSDADDAANYTNRAPYAMVHLIREASITEALANYPEPEQIPERNIALARRKGQQKMAQLLAACTAPVE